MDPDEVDQVRGYIEKQLLRDEIRTLRLQLAVEDNETLVDNDVLNLFATGGEGWQIVIPDGSPDLN